VNKSMGLLINSADKDNNNFNYGKINLSAGSDNDGNEYTTYIDDNGRIINVIPPDSSTTNIKRVENLPELIISTKTGRGAILKPTLRRRDTYQGEIKQVIDCVS